MNSFTSNFSLILLYLIPLSLLTGSFLPDLLISILSIIFIASVIIEKNYKYFQNKYFLIFMLFYVYLILNSSFAIDPFFSLKTTVPYIRFVLFPLAVWHLLEKNKEALKYFTYSFIITFFIAMIDGTYQIIYGYNFIGLQAELFWHNRLILTFHDTMILGGYLARLSPFLIGLLFILFNKNRYFYFYISIFIIILDIIVFYSGERTAIGLILLSSLFVIVFASNLRILRIITLSLIVIILTVISFTSSEIRERNINLTMNQMGFSAGNNELVYFSKYHHSHFMSAMKMFYENPLFGIGPNMFRKLCDKPEYIYDQYSCSTHPHSIYAQILAENGIIGFSFILIIIISIFMRLIKSIRHNVRYNETIISTAEICLISCFFLSLWPFLPSNNFFNNWINVIYFLPVGFYLFIIDEKKENLI